METEKIDLREIKDLINEISINPETSVVAKRIKRSEGPIFQSNVSNTQNSYLHIYR